MSNFKIAAIALVSLVKDTSCLQLHKSNSKLMWLASKKRIKVLEVINILFFEIIYFCQNFIFINMIANQLAYY